MTVLQENLLPAIQDAGRFVASKPQLPALSGVALQAKEGTLFIRSTDLKVGFQTSLGGKVLEEGECVVAVKAFGELIATLKSGPLTLRIEKGQLLLESSQVKTSFQTFPANEFPPFPVVEKGAVTLDRTLFVETLESVLYAASPDEARPVLSSLLLKIEEGWMTVVCTDGYRLSLAKMRVEEAEDISVLIAAKTAQELVRTLSRTKEKKLSFGVTTELLQANFTCGGVSLFVRMTEGNFPPYAQIIPESFMHEITGDVDEWKDALKTSLVFARETSSIVTLQFTPGNCAIVAQARGVGENTVSFPVKFDGDELTLSCNARFLLDVFGHIHGKEVLLSCNDPLKPVKITDPEQSDALSIIMPFKK